MAEKFATLVSLTIDGKGSYGIGASAVPFSKDLYAYLRISDIRDDGTLNLQDLKSVDDEKASEYLLKQNDIVFARTGSSTGRNYFYDGTDGEFVYAGFLIKFSLDEKKVNPKYIKYFCQSKQYKDWINSFNTGSTRGNINAQILGKMPIPIIERKKQDILVSVLSSIDKKIRNNNEINNNLEQQVTTAFYYMFGKYEQNFNTHKPLSTIAKFKYGTMPKKDKLGAGHYQAFSGYQIVGTYPEVMFENPQLIIVARGVGGCGDVKYTPANCYLTNLSIAIITEKTMHDDYLYHYLRLHDTKIMNTGSAQPQITVATLEKFEIPIPPEEEMIRFSDFVQPFKQQYRNNQDENKLLSKLRDTLLSKLMSGELDVSNIDL